MAESKKFTIVGWIMFLGTVILNALLGEELLKLELTTVVAVMCFCTSAILRRLETGD